MSRELTIRYKTIGFCPDVQKIVTIFVTKCAQLQVAQIRLIVKEQDRGLLGGDIDESKFRQI